VEKGRQKLLAKEEPASGNTKSPKSQEADLHDRKDMKRKLPINQSRNGETLSRNLPWNGSANRNPSEIIGPCELGVLYPDMKISCDSSNI
jgi:hypothetical protein